MAADLTTNDPVFQPEAKEPADSMLATSRPGVTRYKRPVVIAIIGALVGILCLGLIFAFALGGGKDDAKKEDDGAIQLANPDLGKLPAGYDSARPDLTGPGTTGLPPAGTDPNATPVTGQPVQPGQQYPQQRNNQRPQLSPAQQRAEAARELAIRQEMAARSGSIMFDQTGGKGAATTGGNYSDGPSDQSGQQTAQQQPQQNDDAEPGRQNGQTRKEQFVQTARIGEDYLKAGIQQPLSRFEVKAGSIIPAALVTQLNSDLPGEVIATVTENVYDHVTGRYVLIPQGTRLFGKYDSKVSYAQRRALVVWNRIIFPNGKSINIGGMIGSDASGAAGLSDRVNNHFGSLLKGVILSTAIAFGGAAADNAGTQNNQLVTAGGGAASQEASRTGQQFVTRELDRQPTITIRPGYRLRVIVDKDMVLAPY